MNGMVSAYRAALGERSFRHYWTGFTLSVCGDSFTSVAFVWLVLERTGSAKALGLLMICFTAPVVISGLIAGWLLDRFDRRLVILIDSLARGLVVALIPALHAAGTLQLWHVYGAACVHGLGMMIPLAGTPSVIPALVRRDLITTANALETLSYTVAGVLGPILAGMLVASIGAALTILIDALSYLAFAICLLRLGTLEQTRPQPRAQAALPPPAATFGAIVRNPTLVATTLMFMTFNVGAGGKAVWLPILCRMMTSDGPAAYGALLGIMAVGETASVLLAGAYRRGPRLGLLISLFQALSGAALLLIAAAPTLWAAGIALFLFGLFSGPLTPWAQSLRMQIIPERFHGRAFATLRTIMQGGNPLGGAVSGLVLPAFGLVTAILTSGLLVALPGLVGFAMPSLRRASTAALVEVEGGAAAE